MTKYTVTIDEAANGKTGCLFDQVLEYKMLPDRVFYVAGTDFEHWILLEHDQDVMVTEKEPNT